jgi:hypothetical protein
MRVVAGMAGAFLTTVAAFGLLLTVLWLIPVVWPYYTLAVGLVIYFLSIGLGAAVAGTIIGSRHIIHGVAFGLTFGLVSAWYVLGPVVFVLLCAPLAALCGGLGGGVCKMLGNRRTAPKSMTAPG